MLISKGLQATRMAMATMGLKTQKQVAERTGIDEAKISRIFNGKALPNRKESVALRDKLLVDPGLWDQQIEVPEEPESEAEPAPESSSKLSTETRGTGTEGT